MLGRLEDEPSARSASGFADVPPDTWFTDAVAWAAEQGIVTGCDPETFGPSDPLTREQLAAILYRYAKYLGMDVSAAADLSGYLDAADVSDWALDAFRWAIASGLIRGVSETRLSPKTQATRAQVATMLMRFDALRASADQLNRMSGEVPADAVQSAAIPAKNGAGSPLPEYTTIPASPEKGGPGIPSV